jgi:2-succinyl-5-enolpyruvyl-6-hydroxy-3-cyclohexene-1-carboxylate synthase
MIETMATDVARDTHLLLRAFCDELARCGMRHACTSPGSRNTPIVLSLAREPRIHTWSHVDERCAGFFALGAARAGGAPVAVTCTSGTASANLAPAVVEAHWARIPLIVLTADRPAELRDNGAGQAIDQIKLYGDAVKWFCEVELPGPALPTESALRWMRTLACRAYWTASEGRPGPVHLNLPLREPLIPTGPLGPDPVPGRDNGRPWVTRRAPSAGAAGPAAQVSVAVVTRGVIVCGRDERAEGMADAVDRLAAAAGWPVLADPLSRARSGANAIATYDLLLRDESFAGSVAPNLVIRVGDLPTSKPLRTWLAGLGPSCEQLALDPDATWQDPAAVVAEIEPGDPVAALQALTDAAGGPAAPARDLGWLTRWTDADERVSRALADALAEDGAGGGALTEPLVAARLGEWLAEPPVAAAHPILFSAASMPIRDLELYLPARRPLPRVLSNRGANGIDGTISTAFGVAAAAGQPVVALIGDVALAHDIGGLLAARRLDLELTIVLINNDGGGIFHFLAISGEEDAFEEHIATPTGLDFAQVAQLFGLRYVHALSEQDLRHAVSEAVGSGAVTLIEVRTDRAGNLALHRCLADTGLSRLRAAPVR